MKYVGKLEGSDKDSGLNSELVFSMPPTSDISGQMFKVNPDGVVLALQQLDRETKDRYILHLEVRDKGYDSKMRSSTVTVIVEDINDHAPFFHFPTQRNQTVSFLWSIPANREITRVNATDDDLGENKTISYFIYSGNKADLFGLDKTTGVLYLRRKVKDTDDQNHKLMIGAQDWGVEQKESKAFLEVFIDVTNATFSAFDGRDPEEKYVLIAGGVAGVTLLFSIFILVIIFLIRRGNNNGSSVPPGKQPDWQLVKTGIQEECGKGEVEKVVAWRGSDADIEFKDFDDGGPGGNYSLHSQPDVTKIGSDGTSKKCLGSPWSSGKDGSLQGQGVIGLGPDPYRKHDFYTFCKVRSVFLHIFP